MADPYPHQSALPGFQRANMFAPRAHEAEEHGHRRRLRSEFQDKRDATPDDELLELILHRAIPRRETRSLARRLLLAFGDLHGVISAPVEKLAVVQGVGSSVVHEMRLMQATAEAMTRCKIRHRDVLSSWEQLLSYCRIKMGHLSREQVRILFLDRRNHLIADEATATGTVDHVPVYPREVVKRALELDASAMIIVHNHPSGDPTPSEEDIAMTRTVQMASETMGIVLHDHVVIGTDGAFSFRSEGLI